MTVSKVKPSPRQGEETRKNNFRRLSTKTVCDYDTYFTGQGIDVGYRGYYTNIDPIVENAIGVDTDFPNYDGKTLPFLDNRFDFVHASHCLEHIEDFYSALKEWYRVLKVGGYMILTVPHQFLYEKKFHKPSRWNHDHKRFYTPARLLLEIEVSLPVNGYRIKRLLDNDTNYDYSIPPDRHAAGCYEIELILQKIERPEWELA